MPSSTLDCGCWCRRAYTAWDGMTNFCQAGGDMEIGDGETRVESRVQRRPKRRYICT